MSTAPGPDGPSAGLWIAQVNVGRLVAPPGDPLVAEFVDNVERLNALGEAAPGFVWRLGADTPGIGALDVQLWPEDPRLAVNATIFQTHQQLMDYVLTGVHGTFLRRRREWFERPTRATSAAWWVEPGVIPPPSEFRARIEHLWEHGPTPVAFELHRPLPQELAPLPGRRR